MDGPNLTKEETESLATANDLRKGQDVVESGLHSHNDDELPIYEIDYTKLIQRFPNIGLLTSNNATNELCMAHPNSTARRENHNDDNHNLPDAPYNYDDENNEDGYLEYHVENSGVKNAKNLRVVYDRGRQRLYVSPSHYNSWKDNDGTKMNPFMLVGGCPPLICGGKANWK